MEATIALAGNPNSGKTCLFNELTGARQHVGNYPGVTVEKKEGRYSRDGHTMHIVDLPGTQLAIADHDRIQIDIDAAGVGWFADATPGDHSEFEAADEGRLLARAGGQAAGRVDLLTVVAHELGHVLGNGHSHDDGQLMSESLPTVPGLLTLTDGSE